MKDVNSVIEIGRLVKDAELKKFNEENGVIQFCIAVNTTTKKDGQYTDVANFFNVKRYGKNLDKLTSMLVKGKQVAVSGYLQQDRWETDGKKNSAIVIVAEDLELLGGGNSNNAVSSSTEGFHEDLPYDNGDCPF